MLDDGFRTGTTRAQRGLEKKLLDTHRAFREATSAERLSELTLKRKKHVAYLHKNLGTLPEGYSALEASQTWIVYWNLHSLALLEAPLVDGMDENSIIQFLASCQCETGGFGGGPNQIAHLASTYAAVMALVTIGTQNAFDIIDRPKLEAFLFEMCVPPEKGGGFAVHRYGEVDIRGCYTAMAVAHVLNLDKQQIAERSGMVSFIKQCQSFEGGLGGEPGNEAHGGYTFCGLAALCLLDRAQELNLAALARWAVHMQGSMEGGFIGRTHKLVDGCYSYWQGAIFAILKTLSLEESTFWNDLVPSLQSTEVLDIPMYVLEDEEVSAHEEVKEQSERKLRKRAQELGLDLKEALEVLVQPSQEMNYDRRIRFDLFRSTFEECQQTLEATDLSFTELFPFDSMEREQLPVHRIQTETSAALFDSFGLQCWILLHCQMNDGGLRDKPNKPADLYHTCYCLSGLAVAQQIEGIILGPPENQLTILDPVLNVVASKSERAIRYFHSF